MNHRKYSFGFSALVASLVLVSACAQQSEDGASTGVAISSFSPSAGSYTDLPSYVYVYFNQTMDESTVTNTSYWALTCGSIQYAVDSVSLSGSVATVYLPSPSWSDGTVCELSASSALLSASGVSLSGTISVSYTMSSDSTSSSSTDTDSTTSVYDPTGSFANPSPYTSDRVFGTVTLKSTATATSGYSISSVSYEIDGSSVGSSTVSPYTVSFSTTSLSNGSHTLTLVITDSAGNVNETADTRTITVANVSAVYRGPTGGSGGSDFTASAPTGYNLLGFFLYTDKIVDRLTPIWKTAWGQSLLTAGSSYGSSGSGDTFVQLTCPVDLNYRVSGIYGRSGSKIDQLGVICTTQDALTTYRSPSTYGGTGGSSFELTCPSGSFVVGLKGRSGSAIDQLQLVCQ